jgi:hypothetical protein
MIDIGAAASLRSVARSVAEHPRAQVAQGREEKIKTLTMLDLPIRSAVWGDFG